MRTRFFVMFGYMILVVSLLVACSPDEQQSIKVDTFQWLSADIDHIDINVIVYKEKDENKPYGKILEIYSPSSTDTNTLYKSQMSWDEFLNRQKSSKDKIGSVWLATNKDGTNPEYNQAVLVNDKLQYHTEKMLYVVMQDWYVRSDDPFLRNITRE